MLAVGGPPSVYPVVGGEENLDGSYLCCHGLLGICLDPLDPVVPRGGLHDLIHQDPDAMPTTKPCAVAFRQVVFRSWRFMLRRASSGSRFVT